MFRFSLRGFVQGVNPLAFVCWVQQFINCFQDPGMFVVWLLGFSFWLCPDLGLLLENSNEESACILQMRIYPHAVLKLRAGVGLRLSKYVLDQSSQPVLAILRALFLSLFPRPPYSASLIHHRPLSEAASAFQAWELIAAVNQLDF